MSVFKGQDRAWISCDGVEGLCFVCQQGSVEYAELSDKQPEISHYSPEVNNYQDLPVPVD